MTNVLYRYIDAAAVWLWTWFGVRPRLIMALGLAMSFADIMAGHGLFNMVGRLMLVIMAIIFWWRDTFLPVTPRNLFVLSYRANIIIRLTVWGQILVLVVDGLLQVWRGEIGGGRLVADIGLIIWLAGVCALMPTGPRRKITLPHWGVTRQAVA